MKKYGVIFCCLGCFALCAYLLEKNAFFADVKTALQMQEIPSSILDIGKMGKILKQEGLIRTLPKDPVFFPGTFQAKSRSVVRILFESNIDTELHVYWVTQKKQKYSTKRYVKARVSAGKKEYALTIPALPEVYRLRIDPSGKPAEIRIRRITLDYDKHEIVLTPDSGLDLLQPLTGIDHLHHDAAGVSFTVVNTDPQLELQLDAVREPKKIEQRAFQRKRQQTLFRHVADSRGMHSFPSTQVITKEGFKKNWPIMSLVLDEADLYHPDTGL
ncbi:MAG: hypothetical protein D3909_01170, partial [Candidatus Electrothrix sp. ATG1]|nr:hypothetical protein [Candidatus Electrothrix sp. ATG1]